MLEYIGKRGEHIVGVPARDLTYEDLHIVSLEWHMPVDEVATLLTSRGLYAEMSTGGNSDGDWAAQLSQNSDQ